MWPSGRHLYCGSRDLPNDFSFATFLAVFFIAYPSVSVLELKAQESCGPPVAGRGAVASVRDGPTADKCGWRQSKSSTAAAARVVAFVRVGDSQQSIQEILVEQGQARVAAMIGDKACADILLRSERVARAARRGLWEDPNFAPLRPEHLNRIAAAQGQFALVEGKYCRCAKATPQYI